MVYVASDTESMKSYQDEEHCGAALAMLRGPPANSEAAPSDTYVDTLQNEGGQPEASEGSAHAGGLLAMSLQRVKDNATR